MELFATSYYAVKSHKHRDASCSRYRTARQTLQEKNRGKYAACLADNGSSPQTTQTASFLLLSYPTTTIKQTNSSGKMKKGGN